MEKLRLTYTKGHGPAPEWLDFSDPKAVRAVPPKGTTEAGDTLRLVQDGDTYTLIVTGP